MKRYLKQVAWGGLVLLVLASFVYALLPKAVLVETDRVGHGDLRITIDEEGQTRIQDRYIVSSPLFGELRRIELDPGDECVGGETVVAVVAPRRPELLDARTRSTSEASVRRAEAARERAQAEIERASATHALAAKGLERAKELKEARLSPIAESEYDQASLDLERARAGLRSAEFGLRVADFEVEQARAVLDWAVDAAEGTEASQQLQLLAPVDGKVLRVHRRSEGMVAEGTALVEIGDPGSLELVVDVLSNDAVKVPRGARVDITGWGGGSKLLGRVRLVEPAGFTKVSALGVEEQRVNVIIDPVLDTQPAGTNESPGWARLGDAYRVVVRIVIREREDVVIVPVSSLFRSEGGWAVFRVDADRAKLTRVDIGDRNAEGAEVRSGLSTGDEVIVYPGDALSDGIAVERR